MELQNQTWTWQKTVFNNDTTKQPRQVGAFTLTFDEYGRVAGTTDCNSFHGSVVVSDHNLKFEEPMAMTRMFCPDSQEAEFVKMLHAVNSFLFTSRGELVLELKYDSGSMFFD